MNFKKRSHYWLRSIPIFSQHAFVLPEPAKGGIYDPEAFQAEIKKAVGRQLVSLTFNQASRWWTVVFWTDKMLPEFDYSLADLEALAHQTFVKYLRRYAR